MRFEFTPQAWERNSNRLVNQVYKMLPMYENKENWISQRDSLLLEFHGYNKIFLNNPNFLVLIAKLYSLEEASIEQKKFRKAVFETMSLLKEISI